MEILKKNDFFLGQQRVKNFLWYFCNKLSKILKLIDSKKFYNVVRIFIQIFTLDRKLLQTFSKFLFSLFQMLVTWDRYIRS